MSHAPDDEALLVLADELQLAGDLRGELIGVQVEIERGGTDRTRRIALRKRERELLAEHGARWANLEGLASEHVFRRGFVDEVLVDVRTFVSRQKEFWATAPWARRLRFKGLKHRARLVGERPDPADAREVCYWVERILASKRVTNFELIDPIVTWARLPGPHTDHEAVVSDAVVDWLLTSGAARTLTGLTLPKVSGDTLWNLRECDAIEDLRLEIDCTRTVRMSDLGALRPRRLRLSAPDPGGSPRDLVGLLHTTLVERVRDLEFPYLALALPMASRLKILRGLGGDLSVLANAPELAGLEELELHVGPDHDYEPMHEPAHLDSLRVLRIVGDISLDDAQALLASPLGRRLDAFDIRSANPPALVSSEWDGVLYL